MAVGLAHTLYCDRPGCRSQITLPNTRNTHEAREVARRQYGWRTRRKDLCPNEPTPAPLSQPTTVADVLSHMGGGSA